MSVYAKFVKKGAVPKYRATEKLQRGYKYFVSVLELVKVPDRFRSEHSKVEKNLKFTCLEGTLEFYHFMPQEYSDMDEADLRSMQNDIAKGKAPYVMFYGMNGASKVMKLHGHDEDYDRELLEQVSNLESESVVRTPLKRSSSDSAPSFSGISPKTLKYD